MDHTSTDRTPASTGARSFFKHPSLAVLLLLLLAAAGWYGNQLLVVLLPENGFPIRFFSVEKGGEWSYHYKHSVQQTPVDEYFRVNGVDDMTMTHTTYESLGVGLPYDPSEGKFTSLKKDGKFDLEMNRPYKSLKFRTAIQAMPKIIHKGEIYDLCPLYGQGTLVEVKVMKRYQYWLMSLAKLS
ncbi:MAG: DUF1850 domain-containing protein [Acidaminococcaceae bacterium]|nr:DUF1850 domain-containing protein [Acidaminococcaceae bacterium]